MFNKARLKLTVYYLLIIMIISLAFSAVIYNSLNSEVDRFDRMQRTRIQLRFGTIFYTNPDPSLLNETKSRIVTTLIVTNLSILAISGVTGYFLAGITLKPIKDMVDEQKRFISDASHEIGTPLTSLKTAMEVFLRSKNKNLKEADILMTESIEEVDKLYLLSSSLLQLARFEVPNSNSKFSREDLQKIIESAVKKVQPLANKKEIKILKNIQKTKIYGSSFALTDLFVILLDNAIKYSDIKKTINLTSINHKDFVEIKVIDEGIGISQRDLPHIFDRFYRADISRSKTQANGYGLGLSIAKKIVESHKGDISIESTINKGATIIVKLPR